MSSVTQQRMKRLIVDHFGGPEVLRVVEEDVPQPRAGEVRVRVLAAGVSFTDSQLRAGTYLGVPKPPFTPGYELVGVRKPLLARSCVAVPHRVPTKRSTDATKSTDKTKAA